MSNCPTCGATMSESCELCERDAEVESLKARVAALEGVNDHLSALVTYGVEKVEQLRALNKELLGLIREVSAVVNRKTVTKEFITAWKERAAKALGE